MKSIKKLLIILFFFFCFIFTDGVSQNLNLGVGDVRFTFGNTKTFEDEVLKSTVAMTSVEQFNKSILSEDISKLKKFYFDNGFFDVQVDTSVRYDMEEKLAFVKFIIQENKRFRIDSIFFNGLEKTSPKAKDLFSKLELVKPNDFYNRKEIVSSTNEIINMLLDNGYMNARLNGDSGTIIHRYNFSPENVLSVSVNFDGTDTLYYFGKTKVKIVDNKYGVSEDILTEQIEFKEGEIYDNEKKITAERNISKFPIVQSTRIEVEKIHENSHVDFIALVTLSQRHEITPSIAAVTLENSFYLGGTIEYLNRYFLGNGRTLSLELNALYNSPELNRILLSTTITQPNLFSNKSSLTDILTVGFYNREDAQNYYLGNSTNLEFIIPKHSFLTNTLVGLTEEFVRYNFDDTTKVPFTIFNTILSITLVNDKTDNPFSPTKGFYNSVTLGSAGVLSRLIIDAFDPDWTYSQYIPVGSVNKYFLSIGSPATILATKFIYYENFEYGDGEKSVPIPSLYRFFSGGSNSLRGWKAKENGILNNTFEGGNFFLESSIELRQKISPRSKDFTKNISAALFIDFGNVWENNNLFRWDQIAFSAGFGIRYDLAVGPIRFDIGYIVYDPSKPDNTRTNVEFSETKYPFALHFAIGQAF
ncbi:MAG: BamA/TamA family outer membrane protein [Ignavibacteria bacterium]